MMELIWKIPRDPSFSCFPSDPPISAADIVHFLIKILRKLLQCHLVLSWPLAELLYNSWSHCFPRRERWSRVLPRALCTVLFAQSDYSCGFVGLLKHLLSLFFNSEKETGNWLLRKYLNVILFSIYSWKHLESSNGSYAVGWHSLKQG